MSNIVIKTKIYRIVYFNPSSNWGVLSVEGTEDESVSHLLDKKGNITVTGSFDSNVYQGCSIEIHGEEATHPRYGKQIALSNYKILVEHNSKESVCNFLTRSSIKGISTQNALKIYNKYKEDSLNVVLNETDKLLSISGIGEKTIENIKSSVHEYKNMEELINYCTQLGFKYALIIKLYRELGRQTLDILKENIYSILDHSNSITFKQLDMIALSNGQDPDDLNRQKYCFLYLLKTLVIFNGSTGIRSQDFKKQFLKELGTIDANLFNCIINLLIQEKKIYFENNRIYYKKFYDIEQSISEKILEVVQRPVKDKFSPNIIKEEIKNFPYKLNKQQIKAIVNTLKSNISVITGSAGSGKSTIQKALVNIFVRHGYNVILVTPTGKAARRLEECVNQPAQTIHRFLGIKTSVEDANVQMIIKNSVIIVDEASMVDIQIFEKLLSSFNVDTKIVLVGDAKQLPSVSAGRLLEDLILSEKVNINILTDIMRQAENSNIILNCSKINNGKSFSSCKEYDFIYKTFYTRENLLNEFLNLYDVEYRRNSLHDIQVLTCYKAQMLGCNNLNKIITEIYNKNEVSEKFGFKEGDKVVHTKNNYKKAIFNGEVGIVSNITEDYLYVDYNGVEVEYDAVDIDELQLAYAYTVHRSQGSEYSIIFVIVDDYTHMLLIRKLLYTAVSRGKSRVYLLGMNDSVDRCISNAHENPRITKLSNFLINERN